MAEERTEKGKAIDLAFSQIEKQFGKGSIMRLGSIDMSLALEAISSGSLSLDAALGVGGYPRGRVIEIFGPESSGKTTLSLHAIAEAQKNGGTAAFIDAEHALDAAYSRNLASISIICWSPSPTAESRHWKSPKSSFAAVPSILLSSTR
jgi:recombination protein RecA